MPVEQFCTAPSKTVLQRGEFLVRLVGAVLAVALVRLILKRI